MSIKYEYEHAVINRDLRKRIINRLLVEKVEILKK